MGFKQKAYETYLLDHASKHLDMVEPEIVGGVTGPEWNLPEGAKRLDHRVKVWHHSPSHGRYALPDGRIAEVTETNGNFPSIVAAIWPDASAWEAYDKPMTFRQYHEEW